MNGFQFGDRVTVKARTTAVYGTIARAMRPRGIGAGGFQSMEPTGEFVLAYFSAGGKPVKPGADGGWPGDPVPDDDGVYDGPYTHGLEPSGPGKEHAGDHRRIRRLPLDAEGVVVGQTVRQEGQYHHGDAGEAFADPSPPYLTVQRVVPVVQVALAVERGPARVIDVWPGDVTLTRADDPEEQR